MKAKQGVNAPDELLADTSFGLIEGFFIISFIVLGVLTGGSLFLGFYYGYIFFKIFGFILLAVLVIDISIYRVVKRAVSSLSSKITNTVKQKINNHRVVDVEVTEV